MSGGYFLVGLRHTICSEKIVKITSMLKEDIYIDNKVKTSRPRYMEMIKLKTDIDSLRISLNSLGI